MTPVGHRGMQEELRRLLREDRPKTVEVVSWAAGNGDRSENGDYLYGKKRLREIDRRTSPNLERAKPSVACSPGPCACSAWLLLSAVPPLFCRCYRPLLICRVSFDSSRLADSVKKIGCRSAKARGQKEWFRAGWLA